MKILSEINPLANVTYGSFGHFPIGVLLQKQNESLPQKKLNEISGRVSYIHVKFTTFSFTLSKPFVKSKLNFELNRLLFLSYNQIYRKKGLITIEQYPVKVLLQTVKNQINYIDGQHWEADEPRISKIVVIGKIIKKDMIQFFFQKCLVK
jgi:G3E family GTPase